MGNCICGQPIKNPQLNSKNRTDIKPQAKSNQPQNSTIMTMPSSIGQRFRSSLSIIELKRLKSYEDKIQEGQKTIASLKVELLKLIQNKNSKDKKEYISQNLKNINRQIELKESNIKLNQKFILNLQRSISK